MIASKGTKYKTSANRKTIKTDIRPRLQASADYKNSVFTWVIQPDCQIINWVISEAQMNAMRGRLVRNKEVADMIVDYWKQIEDSHGSLERYLFVRESGRALLFKLYRLPIAYADSPQLPETGHVEIIDAGPKKWNELANLIAISRQVAKGEHSTNLHDQYDLAVSLIDLIKKEYHLK